eukprot:TRINITY_DN3707_c0_g1_i13.p1 TRINITY_DN3707_c0_g1~~TRINITY_DN3707_c0_g1_i13.p1  ORF type:complete len:295 (-),score=33.46 TRINITY_DN3707_c0_g1_i13:91-975(-)
MSGNNRSLKVHPVTEVSECPFEKASKDPIVTNIPMRGVNSEPVFYSELCLTKIDEVLERLKIVVLRNDRLRWSLCLVSTLSTTAHVAFQAFLIYKFKDTDHIGLFSVLFVALVLFWVSNGFLLWGLATNIGAGDCTRYAYISTLLIYLGLTCPCVAYLSEDHNTYFIVSCVLFFLSVNVFGLYFFAITALFFVGLVFLVLEAFFVGCIEGCCGGCCGNVQTNGSGSHITYHTYYYDKSKTTVTSCIICLCEFEDKTLLCVGACHSSHILHESCMVEWLKVSPVCPICKSPAHLY